jgi:hypothetical protein
LGQNDNELFVSIHPEFLMQMVENTGLENLPSDLMKKLEGVEISEMNPVLMRLKVRDFENLSD